MKKITIGFSKSIKKFAIFSWIIRFIERSPYSHTYLKFENSRGKILIYQASHTMVNFMGEPRFLQESLPIKEYTVELTNEQYAEMLDFCIDRAGMPYSCSENLGIAVSRLLEIFGIRINNIFGVKRSAYKCSELVAEFLENICKIDIPEDLDMVSPKEVDKTLEGIYGKIK